MPSKKKLSFVVPVYNEEPNILPLYRRVAQVMKPLSDRYDYELVFTDNHSTDRTFEILAELGHKDKRVRVLRFSRNFGYQRSIHTGYCHARGDAAMQLDCDLQDPPELVPEFLNLWEKGYHVVYGIRRSRQEGWLINTVRSCFYWLIDLLSEDHLPRNAGDFRLVDRRILDELRKVDDSQPYLRGALATFGFNQIGVPYDRAKREHGKSKLSIRNYLGIALDGILNHSVVPLRIATYTGFAVSLITFAALVGYLLVRLFFEGQYWPPGFATTTILILFSLSLNSIFFGILGEYIGRIYRQVKKRPLTIIEREISHP